MPKRQASSETKHLHIPVRHSSCAWAWLMVYTWLLISPSLGLPRVSVALGTDTELFWVTAPHAVPICLVAAMLTLAPSPGPGPLGARRLLAWAAVWLAADTVVTVTITYFTPYGGLLIFVLLITTVAVALRSPVGRRAAIALTPWLAAEVGLVRGSWELSTVIAFTTAILALMAWLARADRAPSASGSGRR